jgi:hypothetical protein
VIIPAIKFNFLETEMQGLLQKINQYIQTYITDQKCFSDSFLGVDTIQDPVSFNTGTYKVCKGQRGTYINIIVTLFTLSVFPSLGNAALFVPQVIINLTRIREGA